MKRPIVPTLALLPAAALCLIACACTAFSRTPPAPTPTLVNAPTVTMEENNQTLTLHVGDRFLLKLGDTQNWRVTVAGPSVLSRVPNVLVVRGAQGLYEAKQPGVTTLEAIGTAICPPQQACPQYAIDFKLHIVVY